MDEINTNRLKPCRSYTVSGGEHETSNYETSVLFELSLAYERCLAGVKARNLSMSAT